MGTTLRKLDILALSASGDAAEKFRDWLENLREDVAAGMGGGDATVFHKVLLDESTETTADAAVTLATVIALANSLKVHMNVHLASTGVAGVHMTASAETIAAADADDQTSANTLLNELKADYNTHLSESGVHINDDSTNTVSAANATDLATSITLANEIKADYNAHIAAVMATPPIEQ